MKYHPDRNPDRNSSQVFQRLNEAYDILSDENKRKHYDSIRRFHSNKVTSCEEVSIPQHQNHIIEQLKKEQITHIDPIQIMEGVFKTMMPSLSSIPTFLSFNAQSDLDPLSENFKKDISNIFENLIPNSTYQNEITKLCKPIELKYAMSLEDIYYGKTITLDFKKFTITHNRREEYNTQKIINISRGYDTSSPIVFSNEGNKIFDYIGDLHIIIEEIPHDTFKRNGNHLILEKTLTLKESLVGFELEINHINDKKYNIRNYNHIIYPNYIREIPNLGFVTENGSGSLFLKFDIKFPKELNTNVLKILKDLDI